MKLTNIVISDKSTEFCAQVINYGFFNPFLLNRVDFSGNIKVADFGLVVTISEDRDCFKLIDDSPEKRWMAIESIVSLKFSEASGVVS